MSYLEELLPEFRKGAKIRCKSWKAAEYIYIDNKGSVITEKGNEYILDSVDFNSEYWELYHDPEPDWQYIIDNKCLCWFGDDEDFVMAGTLAKSSEPENQLEDFKYRDKKTLKYWRYCRPVRRDEVNFYEDKKDE